MFYPNNCCGSRLPAFYPQSNCPPVPPPSPFPPLPPLPPFPPIPPRSLETIQVQLQNSSAGTVANLANVIFDTLILDSSPAISYNSTTGVFTITAPGRYLVNYWVNTDGAGEATSIIFSAEIGATSIRTSSSVPTTALQIYGQGVFEVGSVPVSFSLVNRTGDTVTLGTSLIQADLIIVKL